MEDDLQTKGSMPLNIAIFAFGCLVFAGTMYGLTRSSTEDKKVHQLEQVAKEAKAEAEPDQGEFAKMEAGGPAGEAPAPAASNGPEGAAPPDATSAPVAAPPADPAASGGTSAPSGATGNPPPPPSAMNEPAMPPLGAMVHGPVVLQPDSQTS